MKFTLEPCPHCGRTPSRNEIVAELAQLQKKFNDLFHKWDRLRTKPALERAKAAGRNYVDLKREYDERFRRKH